MTNCDGWVTSRSDGVEGSATFKRVVGRVFATEGTGSCSPGDSVWGALALAAGALASDQEIGRASGAGGVGGSSGDVCVCRTSPSASSAGATELDD